MKRLWKRFFSYFEDKPEPTKRIQVYLPERVAHETARLIMSYGSKSDPHEGITYWAGIPADRGWVITTALAPEATTKTGSYTTSTIANSMIVDKVNSLHLQLLGQVHGHPSDWVSHSDWDNLGAFMPYEGFYSVVVPWYGSQGLLPLTSCGIHQYLDGSFVRLSNTEIENRFVLLPTSADLRKEL